MKYISSVILFILLFSQLQAKTAQATSVVENLYLDTVPLLINPTFIQEFQRCYHKGENEFFSEEIMYIEAVNNGNEYKLSVLKGEHSKETYLKLVSILECLNVKQQTKPNIKFILLNTKVDRRNKEHYKKVLQNFRDRYSIGTQVEELIINYTKPIR